MTNQERVVVVGAGAAGLRSAERLRELGFDGEIVIVGDEPRRPYHRPMVSKHLLYGAARPYDITCPVHNDIDVKWRLGTMATQLETDRRVVHLPGGEELKYDGLVIATGLIPRHLPGSPRHDPRVRMMRTVDDVATVRRLIQNSDQSVVVIGTGFTGCDVAVSARYLGRDVTLIGRSSGLLGDAFGPQIGRQLLELHAKHRTRLALGTQVRNWIRTKDGLALHLTDGQLIVAGCVVLAIGSIPSTHWLRGSGLVVEDGVLTEASCFAAGGVDDIVVAGDIARWPNLRYDEVPRRVEHWINAVEMGRHAAESLMLGKSNAKPFAPLPRVWSSQYDVRFQIAGVPSLGTDTVRLADGITGHLRNDQLVAVTGWDRPKAMMQWTAELARRLPVPDTTQVRAQVSNVREMPPRPDGAPGPGATASASNVRPIRDPRMMERGLA